MKRRMAVRIMEMGAGVRLALAGLVAAPLWAAVWRAL